MRRAVSLLAALTACTGETTETGPIVSVLRQTRADCFELLAGPAPASGLVAPSCATLPANPSSPTLFAGIDLVQVVIDYGDIDFEDSVSPAAPTPSVLVDGKAVDLILTALAQPSVKGRTYFVGYFVAPAILSNHVEISVPVTAGYSTKVAQILRTVELPTTISVLKRMSTGCYAPIGAAPAPQLELKGLCDIAVTEPLYAVVDLIEVVVDLGTPNISDTASIPAPLISIVADGQARTVDSGARRTSASGRGYFLATLHTPVTTANDVRISVKSSASAPTAKDLVLSTTAPALEASVSECNTEPCEATAAVGVVHFTVAVPGDVPQSVAVHSLIEGAPAIDPISPLTTAIVGGHTEQSAIIQVPEGVVDGAVWTLQAQLGATVDSVDIILRAPTIRAALSCDEPCTMAAGTTVGLTVTAPAGIRSRQAVYNSLLDGVPLSPQATLDLRTLDVGANTLSGQIALKAPSVAGSWTIDASVNGYAAQTLVVQVTP